MEAAALRIEALMNLKSSTGNAFYVCSALRALRSHRFHNSACIATRILPFYRDEAHIVRTVTASSIHGLSGLLLYLPYLLLRMRHLTPILHIN